MSKATDEKFADLWAKANAAGMAAAAAAVPVPMVVTRHANPLNDASPVVEGWHVPDGVCGFGWVHLKGNTAFGKWAKKTGLARPDYPTGLAISSKVNTQSLARNEAWANATATVLRAYGVTDAAGRSRID